MKQCWLSTLSYICAGQSVAVQYYILPDIKQLCTGRRPSSVDNNIFGHPTHDCWSCCQKHILPEWQTHFITHVYVVAVQYSILADIKRVCVSRDVLAALMTLSAGPLSRHPRMSEEDHHMLQLLLTFFRNLVSIPDPPVAAAAAAQTTMQVCGIVISCQYL